MSDTTLRDLVLKRLDADTKPEDEWSALVLAAPEGPDELAKLLDEEGPEAVKALSPRAAGPSSRGAEGAEGSAVASPSAPSTPASPSSAPSPSKASAASARRPPSTSPRPRPHPRRRPQRLRQVELRRGPRAPAHRRHLPLERPQQDLARRLEEPPPPKAALAADFALEGERGSCTVACDWPEGAELEAATSWAQVKGKPRTPKEALGWKDALESHRPFLSYNELGSLLDEGPSKLYDALAKVLGLNSAVGCGAGGRFTMSLASAEPSAWLLQVTEQSRPKLPNRVGSNRLSHRGLLLD